MCWSILSKLLPSAMRWRGGGQNRGRLLLVFNTCPTRWHNAVWFIIVMTIIVHYLLAIIVYHLLLIFNVSYKWILTCILIWCPTRWQDSVWFIIVLIKCAGGGESPEEISGREKNLPGSLKLSFWWNHSWLWSFLLLIPLVLDSVLFFQPRIYSDPSDLF